MTTLTAPTATLAAANAAIENTQATLLNRIKSLYAFLDAALSVYAERRDMLKLTDQELSDIGVTRQQIIEESKRSFFDIPNRH